MCIGSRRQPVGASAAIAVLVALPICQGGDEYLHVQSTITRLLEGQTKILDRCFYEQRMYAPFLPGSQGTVSAATYRGCQLRCRISPLCSYFTFFSQTHECRLAGHDALYQNATAFGKGMAIAGPQVCPKFPSGCVAMPGRGFPGRTANESMFAWPLHRVPQNMECWPKNWTTNAYEQCRTFKVLESTFTGWPGKCRGLRLVLIPHLESCESYCKKKLTCAAYQEVQKEKPFGPKTCWHADATSGIDCYERRNEPDFTPLSAKRFMRGNVRVLMDLGGVEVLGLYNVFPETYFIHVEDAAKACRYHCYSNLLCQYWQYYLESGCWVEDPIHTGGNPVQYPATTESWIVSSQRSRTVLSGEYIQHVCFDQGEPGHQVQSKWTTVARHTYCSEDIRKNLGGVGGNLEACKELVLADASCGNQMYSNSWQCFCVLHGEVCEPSSSSDNTLYQHSMVQEEGKLEKFAKNHKGMAAKMQEHGFKPLDWLASKSTEGRIFEATITLEGLHFEQVGATQKVILVGRYTNTVAAALRVPSSSLKDLHNNPGSLTLLRGATPSRTKVSFIVLTDNRSSAPDIRDCLQEESFTKRFTNVTTSTAPRAIDEGVKIIEVAVIRRGGAIPHHDGPKRVKAFVKALKTKGSLQLNEWGWLFVFLLGGSVAGVLWFCQKQISMVPQIIGFRGGDDSTDSDSMELAKPLDRHAEMVPSARDARNARQFRG